MTDGAALHPAAGPGGDGLLEVRNLSVALPAPGGHVRVLDDITLSLQPGEIRGVIGESGSGKSMLALAIMQLLPPGARVEGAIYLNGRDLLALRPRDMNVVRGSEISMIFQEPMTALDPVFTIGHQMVETLQAHAAISYRAAKERALDMLRAVGINDPARRFDQYPHHLSGGMRQRVLIGMALSCEPDVMIADEPTTAVDITIQAQLLELIGTLARERGTSVIFITHDVGVVAEICERVSTMYAGQLVEQCAADDLLTRPLHPYASGLIGAIPRVGQLRRKLFAIPGRVPSPADFPRGCRFAPRCPHARDICEAPVPLTDASAETGAPHFVRCVRSGELTLPGVLDFMPPDAPAGVA